MMTTVIKAMQVINHVSDILIEVGAFIVWPSLRAIAAGEKAMILMRTFTLQLMRWKNTIKWQKNTWDMEAVVDVEH